MILQLPVLYKDKEGVLFNQVEIKKPGGKVLMDTEDVLNRVNKFMAMKTLSSGCTIRIFNDEGNSITSREEISYTYDKMSNKNMEYVSQQAMVLFYDGEDYVEGVYSCPRCGEKQIAEKKIIEGTEIDTRDRITDLFVGFMKNESELFFPVEFTNPVKIATGETEEDLVYSIEMTFPTVENHVQAFASVGESSKIKLQYAIWIQAIVKVNGQPVDSSWRRACGMQLFRNLEDIQKDLGKISETINRYGIDPRLNKECGSCGKEWRPLINTLNFFESALQ